MFIVGSIQKMKKKLDKPQRNHYTIGPEKKQLYSIGSGWLRNSWENDFTSTLHIPIININI